MNKKIILFFSLLSISLLITGCFLGSSKVDTGDANEGEEISADSMVEETESVPLEDIEINTESSDVSRSTSREVVIENFQFNPSDVSISVGDTVEWVNLDSVAHTVSFEDARFDVEIPAGSTISYTFESDEDLEAEGRYFCKFHPSMQGSVLVE